MAGCRRLGSLGPRLKPVPSCVEGAGVTIGMGKGGRPRPSVTPATEPGSNVGQVIRSMIVRHRWGSLGPRLKAGVTGWW